MIKIILILLCLTNIVYSDQYLIELNHIRQEPQLCVPACISIILDYYGESIDQETLKKIIENIYIENPQNRLYTKTTFAAAEKALKILGYPWEEKKFDINSGNRGIEFIKNEIKNKNPVIVSIDRKYGQHAVIVNGFTDSYFIICDPAKEFKYTTYSFKEFRKIWNVNDKTRKLLITRDKLIE